MTPAEFKKKWAKVTAKETAAYQSHFDDLCRLLKIAPPLEADPAGEFFCYQKHVTKDAELFDLDDKGEETSKRGFADVWKKGFFGWEYKGKHKNLDAAYRQLLRYREALQNPPLLVVCDFDRFIVKTNFNGTVQEVHQFTNAQIDDPKNLRLLRNVFSDPDFLKPQRTTAEVESFITHIGARARLNIAAISSKDVAGYRDTEIASGKSPNTVRFTVRKLSIPFHAARRQGLITVNLVDHLSRAENGKARHRSHSPGAGKPLARLARAGQRQGVRIPRAGGRSHERAQRSFHDLHAHHGAGGRRGRSLARAARGRQRAHRALAHLSQPPPQLQFRDGKRGRLSGSPHEAHETHLGGEE